MKKILSTLVLSLVATVMLLAQAPQTFSYQTVVRDNNWQVIQNQSIGIQVDIVEDIASGSIVYSEEHTATTNDIGLINLAVGGGTVATGLFSNIDWGNHSYFMKISVDVSGGSNYVTMGTTQLRSVPYALFAEKSNNAGPQGIQGVAGNDGNDGVDGTNGVDGVQGIQGLPGDTGVAGPQGIQGVAGNDGADGLNGTNGAVGATGPQGIQGIAGLNGTNSVCGYSIGDTAYGGIIFYLDATGCHGLVAKATDEGAFILCSQPYLNIRCLATGIYAGAQNTKKIIAMTAYWNTLGNGSITCPAAMVCDTLTYGGYSDWYLPSKEELDLLYVNLHLQGLGVFNGGAYISSSEWESGDEWHYATYFYNHLDNSYHQKGSASNVRAVRAF